MTFKYLLATCISLSALNPMQAAFAQPSMGERTPLVQVSGSATVRVTPDEVYLTVGIQSRDKNLQVATDENAGRVAKAQAVLKQHGVPDKSVQVNYLQVQPNYDSRYPEHTTPVSFTARRSIGIKVTNVAGFERLLNDLYAIGINEVENLEYRSSALRQHRDKAREMAAAAAREKADALTAQLGVKRGKAVRISENQGSIFWGGSSQFANRSMTQQNMDASQQGGNADGDGALSVGQISVTAHINVDFLIE